VTPPVSIVTPSYNQAAYIERTIRSVLSQDVAGLEYLVVDGGSTDGTLEILRRYSSRLRWWSAPDGGHADAVNRGFRATSGAVLGWLNSDDLYEPGAVRAALDFLAEHPEVDVVYGDANHVDASGRVIERYPTEPWDAARLAEVCFISQPATFFRRRVVEQHGGLDTGYRYSIDYEFWLRLAGKGVRFAYLPRLLAATRLHPAAATVAQRVACHAATNSLTRRHLGRTPDRWLFQYAHAVLEQDPRRRLPRPLASGAFAGLSLYAALRWNRGVTPDMLYKLARWTAADVVRSLRPTPRRGGGGAYVLSPERGPNPSPHAGAKPAPDAGPQTTVEAGVAVPWNPAHGVNVFGYLRSEIGLGAIARGFVAALRARAVPLGLRDVPAESPNAAHDPSLTLVDGPTPYPVNLVCVNPNQHFVAKARLGEELFRDHYNIGVWFWELPVFPGEWYDRFAEYDEIWATSSFIANALIPVSPIPIVRLPAVMVPECVGSRPAGRERLGVGPDELVYLFVFDFASNVQRKNPLATIEAFKRAFAPTDGARLVIKCTNEHMEPAAHRRLLDAAAGHAVSILTGFWTRDELLDLMAACDVYVSLHRSEGLGLTIAEAMAQGKPVIATGWSGNTDFMTEANSFPVGYELVELAEDSGPYRAGSLWAEPSVEHAARLMRLVFDDRALARARGVVAKADIERCYSRRAVGEAIQQRLALVYARRPALVVAGEPEGSPRWPAASATSVPWAPSPAISNVPPVPPLDLGRSSHGPLGVLVKRGLDYLLRYHTHYQGEINLAFAGYMRELEAENKQLRARVDALAARLENIAKDRARR
jgi:glycosyltransferase involved in cell wall biosynthesis